MPSDKRMVTDTFFKCRKCGQCCKGYGGTYLTDDDIERISDYINSDPARFVDQYCSLSGNRPVLAQRRDGYCIFFDQLCTIHPVKPLMCRKWPFLESILVDPINWLTMANSCPGIRTDVDLDMLAKLIRLLTRKKWKPSP